MSDEKKVISLSADAQKILDMVKKLSVLELADLVKAMEDEFGVSAAAPVAMAMMPSGDASPVAAVAKSEFDVELTSVGDNKIGVIKVVKEITGLGLKEAKDKVDGAPSMIKEKVSKEDADAIKAKLEAAGATVTLK